MKQINKINKWDVITVFDEMKLCQYQRLQHSRV